jgi:hypothetical protein
MNNLTGTVDTDTTVLLLLPLVDIRNISLTNKYFSNLCHLKILNADKYIDTIRSVKNVIRQLNNNKRYTLKSTASYNLFVPLMKKINIEYSKPYDNCYDSARLNIIIYHYVGDSYMMCYQLLNTCDHIFVHRTYECNKKNIIEFLTHIYYDKLYDDICKKVI